MENPSKNPLSLYGKTLGELKAICATAGMPGYSAKQIAEWLYKKHCTAINDMSNVSKTHRDLLSASFVIGRTDHEADMESSDGTIKYLFPAAESRKVEAVWLPEETRGTLCLSTQAGCKMACAFCMTGRQGFGGNLSAGEICNQYASNPFRDRITNIVYMGMGEPFDNIVNTMKSLEIFTSDWGYAMSPARITVSTVGVLPGLKTFLDGSRCHLAISLHSPFDQERQRLMPVQKTWPVEEVIEVLRGYDWSGQRRLSFEYIMFGGINDSDAHAQELARLVSRFKCRVNLLHYHSLPDSDLKGSPRERMESFQNILKSKGIITTIRKSRGEDILAACGMLSTKNSPHI